MSIQHKIIAIPLCIMVFMVVVSFFFIQEFTKTNLGNRIETELGRTATSAIESFKTLSDQQNFAAIDELADRLGKASKARITFIDQDGVVLGDSKLSVNEVIKIENHADRPEIVGAMTSGLSTSKRYSSTIKQDLLYVAAAKVIDSNDRKITARASMPLSDIAAAVSKLRWIFGLSSCIGLFVVMLLGLFAGQIVNKAVLHEKSILENRVEDRTRIITIMQSMTGLLNTCASIDEAASVVNKIMPVLLPNISGAIAIIKSSRNRLDVLLSWGKDWPGRNAYLPNECWALRRGHQHISKANNLHIQCDHMNDDIDRQTICIPLIAQGETIGVFHAMNHDEDLSSEDIKLIASVAEQIGLALANIQLRDSLREQAIRDPLTGLYNRRYMLEALDQMVSRSERQQSNMAVMMLDVDHFKRFNDTFGHKAGDVVLSNISSEMKHNLPIEDTTCRYGGEEFCIVCPDISPEDAVHVAEKLCEAIRRLDLQHDQKSLGKLSISVGVAMYPAHGTTAGSLIQRADEFLYMAKEQGRDRVVSLNAANAIRLTDSKDTDTNQSVA